MLVSYYKGDRIIKARRSRRLKGKPEWQDVIPPSKDQREAWKVADEHEARFSRAFLKAVRTLLGPEDRKRFLEAWRSGSPREVLNSLPMYREGATSEDKVWTKFKESLSRAYAEIIQQTGDFTSKELKKSFGINMGFTLEPVAKQEAPLTVATIPVNPYSIAWIDNRVNELVLENITQEQLGTVTDIIGTAMEKGVRAEEVYDSIESNIGLLDREWRAVENRALKLEKAGVPYDRATVLTDKYREELLKKRAARIARTEVVAAQSQGRLVTWRLAKEEGMLPAVERVWISAPMSPNPARPCEICLGLDGKTAKLEEPYESEILGPVEAPPAHPHCRCTETLKKVKEG